MNQDSQAEITKECLREQSVNVLEWPSQSPALEICENGCALGKRNCPKIGVSTL